MLVAADGRYELAVYLLLVAILLDTADGRLARLLKATSKFGQEMDSLSDAISFCAAPALLVYHAILQPLHGVGVVISLTYLVAGVYRLARFNIISDIHEKAHRTVGVPTPVGAGYLMVLVLMRDHIPVPAAAAVVVMMAMLMVSRVRLPELKGRGFVPVAMLIGMASYLAIMAWPNWYTVAWWSVWNAVILVAARREDRDLELTELST